jgi:hypothetical protein
MQSRSVLNWSNPERGTDRGAVFLWTDAGRPQMIACAFEWAGLKHEFQSLSTDPITAERRGGPVHRFGPGVEWKPLPKAPPPAAERSGRLTQMRRQAQRFRVKVGSKQEWSETRLLPQPVYRSPSEAAADVGVFLFVQGTDPECVLLLEVTAEKEWRYALARQTKWGLKAELDDTPAWEPEAVGKLQRHAPFLVIPQKPDSTP